MDSGNISTFDIRNVSENVLQQYSTTLKKIPAEKQLRHLLLETFHYLASNKQIAS